MNQIKIGQFIARCRKTKSLTQKQLAEQLGITDKAVSKWERGIALPDPSLMLALCDLLGISVNELLSGERITTENENQKNEQLLLEMARELEKKNNVLWTSMWVLMGVSIVALLAGLLVAALLIPEGAWQLVAVIGVCIAFLIPCFYALKLEVSVGAYRCKSCGHEFVPDYGAALMAMHCGTTRYLECPCCHKRTWCKKVFKK